MPHVQITWVEGRTPEQKRKIAERITGVLIEDGRAKRENIHVAFVDVPGTNYAEAGVLVGERMKKGVSRFACLRRQARDDSACKGVSDCTGRAGSGPPFALKN